MSYSGIIFDLDGTLLNTIEDLAKSTNSILEKYNFPVHETMKYKHFVGNGMRNLLIRALPDEERDEKKVNLYLPELVNEYKRNWSKTTKPYQGINELINNLENSGIRMFVLSNKPHQFTEKIVDKFFGLKHFDLVYGAREDIPQKPDPYSAHEISRLSGIATSDFLYLGDSDVDMITANKAGMYAVGAAWGFRDEDELWMNGAKAVIKKPLDLLDIVK